jgi:hypothetical protein
MTQCLSPEIELAGNRLENEVADATERLFDEIAVRSGSLMLRQSVATIREHISLRRLFQPVMISECKAEYEALLACWHRRDKTGLQRLLVSYFKRRWNDVGPAPITYSSY